MPHQQSPPVDDIEATVGNVLGEGSGRYAVTYPNEADFLPKGATITFSLSEWEGSHEPRPGQVVVLSEIEKFHRGWRARRARPIRPPSKQKKE